MNAMRFLAATVVGAVILTVAAGPATAADGDGMGRASAGMVCPMAKPADAPQPATRQAGKTEGKTVTRKPAKDASAAAAAPRSKSGGKTATKTATKDTNKSEAKSTGKSVRKPASAAPAKETTGRRKTTGDSKPGVGKNAGVRDRVA